MNRLPLALLALLVACLPAFAEKNATFDPMIATLGSPVASETFDAELSKTFSAAKGEWKAIDGVLVGKELADDKHAAVLNYQKKNHDSVVRFSFKLDDETKGFNFSLNHKGGHLFRVVVASTKMTINLDKDKKDPKSKAVVMATAKGAFEQGKWYTMQIEMVGQSVAVQTDNGLHAKATHAKLDTDKPNYRFVMRSQTLSIDDLNIWEVGS
ncbi:MAG: family 16 glycoside hydrolase [Rubripirellula sp.]